MRSWRPAMPSISGPRSTVARSFDVTPFVSGAARSLLVMLSSMERGLRSSIPGPHLSPGFVPGWHRQAVTLTRNNGPSGVEPDELKKGPEIGGLVAWSRGSEHAAQDERITGTKQKRDFERVGHVPAGEPDPLW